MSFNEFEQEQRDLDRRVTTEGIDLNGMTEEQMQAWAESCSALLSEDGGKGHGD
jgi:hypothetical protein